MEDDRWVTEQEAARYTGYSRFWFQAKRCRGGGPLWNKMQSGAVRYHFPSLKEYMESGGVRGCMGPPPEKPRALGPYYKGIKRNRLLV